MKGTFLPFLFILFFNQGISQSWEWAKIISHSSYWTYGRNISVNQNQNLISSFGEFSDSPTGLSDVYFDSYDSIGNLLLSFKDTTGSTLYNSGSDENNGYFNVVKNNSGKFVINKFDNQGNISWTGNSRGSAVTTFQDNLYIGETNMSLFSADDTIYRFSLSGNLKNSFILNRLVHIISLKNDDYGNLYIIGDRNSGAYLAKYDSLGNLKWDLFTAGNSLGPTRLLGIAFDTLSNIYITGCYSYSFNIGNVSFNTLGSTYNSLYIAKIDSNGICQWGDVFNSYGYNGAFGMHILSNKDGVYIGAVISKLCVHGSDTIFASPSTYSLLKYDYLGNFIETIDLPMLPRAAIASNHAIYFTGPFKDTLVFGPTILNSQNKTSSYLAKYATSNSIDGIKDNNYSAETFLIYPNPSRGVFTIFYSGEIKEDLLINIYTSKGQKIFSETIPVLEAEVKKSIDFANHPQGVYFVEVISERKKITRRIVIQ